MAWAPVFAESDPGVEHLQPGPQAADALQRVPDAGFKVLLHLQQRLQRVHPARKTTVWDFTESQRAAASSRRRRSPPLQVAVDELRFFCQRLAVRGHRRGGR